MAEDTGIDADEAAELERLLEGGEGEEAGEEAAKKFSFSKKAMIITGAGAIVFLAVVGTGAYLARPNVRLVQFGDQGLCLLSVASDVVFRVLEEGLLRLVRVLRNGMICSHQLVSM